MNEQHQQLPIVMIPQQQQVQACPTDEPPARVLVAIQFLSALTFKQMTRAVVNDISIEIIPPPKFTGSEEAAQHAACDLLESYFQGRMELNDWEKSLLKDRDVGGREEGTLLRCLACAGQQPNCYGCRICKGTGSVLVYPSKEGA